LKVAAWPTSSIAAQNFADAQDTALMPSSDVIPVDCGWLQVSNAGGVDAEVSALATPAVVSDSAIQPRERIDAVTA
jgi:hypothetical protein